MLHLTVFEAIIDSVLNAAGLMNNIAWVTKDVGSGE